MDLIIYLSFHSFRSQVKAEESIQQTHACLLHENQSNKAGLKTRGLCMCAKLCDSCPWHEHHSCNLDHIFSCMSKKSKNGLYNNALYYTMWDNTTNSFTFLTYLYLVIFIVWMVGLWLWHSSTNFLSHQLVSC